MERLQNSIKNIFSEQPLENWIIKEKLQGHQILIWDNLTTLFLFLLLK